jgi:hypothetical protein
MVISRDADRLSGDEAKLFVILDEFQKHDVRLMFSSGRAGAGLSFGKRFGEL